MKKFLALGTALSFLILAGCNSAPVINSVDTSAIVANVKSVAAAACKFVPAAETILSIINADAAMTVNGIAGAICNAVTALKASPGVVPTVTIDGKVIQVKGSFIK